MTRAIIFPTRIQPKVLLNHMEKINKYVFKLSGLNVIVEIYRFQKMRYILCHNVW
jgi:hypothetical protein